MFLFIDMLDGLQAGKLKTVQNYVEVSRFVYFDVVILLALYQVLQLPRVQANDFFDSLPVFILNNSPCMRVD
jgi:hypothetical protein